MTTFNVHNVEVMSTFFCPFSGILTTCATVIEIVSKYVVYCHMCNIIAIVKISFWSKYVALTHE